MFATDSGKKKKNYNHNFHYISTLGFPDVGFFVPQCCFLLLIIKGPPFISAKNLVTVREVNSRKVPRIKRGNKERKKTQEKLKKEMRTGRYKI